MRSGDRLTQKKATKKHYQNRNQSKTSTCSQRLEKMESNLGTITAAENTYYKFDTISGRRTDCTTQFKSRERSYDFANESMNEYKQANGFKAKEIMKSSKTPYFAMQSTKKLTEFQEFNFSKRLEIRSKKPHNECNKKIPLSPNQPIVSAYTKTISQINGGGKTFSYINESDAKPYDSSTQSQCIELLTKLKNTADSCHTKFADEKVQEKYQNQFFKLQKEVEAMNDKDIEQLVQPVLTDSIDFDKNKTKFKDENHQLHESVGSLLSSFTSANLNTITISSLDSSDIFHKN